MQRVIIDDEDSLACYIDRNCFRFVCWSLCRLAFLYFQRNENGKATPFPFSRLEFYLSAKHFYKFLGYGESKSNAFRALCTGKSCECLEHSFTFLLRHSAARVFHADGNPLLVVASRCPHTAVNSHATLCRVFYGIARQVVDNLFNSEGVASVYIVQILVVGMQKQLQSLFFSLWHHCRNAVRQKSCRAERNWMRLHFAGIQTVEIEQCPHQT